MALSTCAAILLLLVTVDAICCPCFTSNRKGIMLVHWVVANFIVSGSSAQWRSTSFGGSYGVLLPWATVVLLAESTVMGSSRSCCMSYGRRITTVSILLFMDAICVVVNILSELLATMLLASLLIVGIVFQSIQKNKKSHLRTEKELLLLQHDDLFCDPYNAFSGSGGLLNYCAITATILIKLFPLTGIADIVLYIAFLLRSIATIQLVIIPAIFGGTVQSVKLISTSLRNWRAAEIIRSKLKDEGINFAPFTSETFRGYSVGDMG